MGEAIHREMAAAKVNLNLKILGKREDGFHELETLMVPISLADELTFYSAEDYVLECDVEGVPTDESNLVSKALRLFEQASGLVCKYRVVLEKKVPHGAGLGGGSADAAAMLRGLNALHGSVLSREELLAIAAEIGSDIPFFIENVPCVCKGRGERVEPVTLDLSGCERLLLLKPWFSVETPSAYKAWLGSKEISGVEYAAKSFAWGLMGNDLERPVFEKHRFLAEVKMWLMAQPGVEWAMMSGSGSTVFAVLQEQGDAEALAQMARQALDPTLWTQEVRVL